MKKIKLFNIFFPLWLIVFFPPIILFTLPINFVIDSIVLLILLKIYDSTNIKQKYKNNILYVWIVGFVSDFVGAVMLLSSTILDSFINPNGSSRFIEFVMTNPFRHTGAFLFTLLCTLISGLLIYLFNIKFNLKEIKNKKKIAFFLALITAPYFFFFPSEVLYKTAESIYINNLNKYQNTYIGDNSNVSNIVKKLSSYYDKIELITNDKPYTIIINSDDLPYTNLDEYLKKDTAILFNLVINADKIVYKINDNEYEYNFEDINAVYNNKLRDLTLKEIIDMDNL